MWVSVTQMFRIHSLRFMRYGEHGFWVPDGRRLVRNTRVEAVGCVLKTDVNRVVRITNKYLIDD